MMCHQWLVAAQLPEIIETVEKNEPIVAKDNNEPFLELIADIGRWSTDMIRIGS